MTGPNFPEQTATCEHRNLDHDEGMGAFRLEVLSLQNLGLAVSCPGTISTMVALRAGQNRSSVCMSLSRFPSVPVVLRFSAAQSDNRQQEKAIDARWPLSVNLDGRLHSGTEPQDWVSLSLTARCSLPEDSLCRQPGYAVK